MHVNRIYRYVNELKGALPVEDFLGRRCTKSVQRIWPLVTCSKRYSYVLSAGNINPRMKDMDYAVRGPISARAAEIEKELKQGKKKPFKSVVWTNLGDCHAMGQKPVTFTRQVLAVCSYPALMDNKDIPEDVKKRARAILDDCGGGSVGSYSESCGLPIVRDSVARYITKRDGGVPADTSNIILTSGASEAVTSILSLLNSSSGSKPPGVLIPIPQFPIYSATLVEYGMKEIHYFLDEDNDWNLNTSELKRAIEEGKKTCEPRGIVVINPGNPTGSVFTEQNIQEIIKFATDEKLFIIADEVYQDNIYDENAKFHSFKKVMMNMGPPYNEMELASLMSASKGMSGECGIRGGYFELVNTDPEVKFILMKSISAKLCSSTLGQITIDCIVNPPQEGDQSYELYQQERKAILESMKERAKIIADTLNNMEGMKCNRVAGSMYAFPRIFLSDAAIAKAKSLEMSPDSFYAFQLLEKTGICTVPGAGFGQKPGTFHFRTTILPPEEMMKEITKRLEEFHLSFMNEYK